MIGCSAQGLVRAVGRPLSGVALVVDGAACVALQFPGAPSCAFEQYPLALRHGAALLEFSSRQKQKPCAGVEQQPEVVDTRALNV